MFTNCNCCCVGNCYMPNEDPYLQIENASGTVLFFVLHYTIDGTVFNKRSLVFRSHQKERLRFPANAQKIKFDLFRNIPPTPTIICTGTLQHAIPTCFKVLITQSGFSCIQVHC